MNPYEVLGVSSSASIEEVEARYRLLIREYHPDLHQDEGPQSLAHCLAVTQELNAAMTRIRGLNISDRPRGAPAPKPGEWSAERDRASRQWAGENPFYRPPNDPARDPFGNAARGGVGSPGGPGPAGGPNTGPTNDWFGNPIDHGVDEPVPCPFCGLGFQRLVEYEMHLQHDHNFRFVAPAPKRAAGPFSLAGLIGWMRFIPIWFVALITFGMWKVFGFYYFTGSLCFLALVLWTQTSPRFRRGR